MTCVQTMFANSNHHEPCSFPCKPSEHKTPRTEERSSGNRKHQCGNEKKPKPQTMICFGCFSHRFLWCLPLALRFAPHRWLCGNDLARSSTSGKESASEPSVWGAAGPLVYWKVHHDQPSRPHFCGGITPKPWFVSKQRLSWKSSHFQWLVLLGNDIEGFYWPLLPILRLVESEIIFEGACSVLTEQVGDWWCLSYCPLLNLKDPFNWSSWEI